MNDALFLCIKYGETRKNNVKKKEQKHNINGVYKKKMSN